MTSTIVRKLLQLCVDLMAAVSGLWYGVIPISGHLLSSALGMGWPVTGLWWAQSIICTVLGWQLAAHRTDIANGILNGWGWLTQKKPTAQTDAAVMTVVDATALVVASLGQDAESAKALQEKMDADMAALQTATAKAQALRVAAGLPPSPTTLAPALPVVAPAPAPTA